MFGACDAVRKTPLILPTMSKQEEIKREYDLYICIELIFRVLSYMYKSNQDLF